MGLCLSVWGTIEEHLFGMFWRILGCKQEPAAIIYYRTPGVDVRLTLLNEIVRSLYPEVKNGEHPHRDLKEWGNIFQGLHDHLGKRRRIAHQQLFMTFEFDQPVIPGKDYSVWWELWGTNAERLRRKEASSEPLTIQDLYSHYLDLMALKERLRQFGAGNIPARLEELARQEAQQEKGPRLEGDQPQ